MEQTPISTINFIPTSREIPLVADFEPTAKQVHFLQAILNPKADPNLETWLESAEVSKLEYQIWRVDPAFIAWLSREVESSLAFYRLEWLRIGIYKMKSDRETWREMGKIFYPEGLKEPITNDSERGQLEAVAVKLIQRIESARK